MQDNIEFLQWSKRFWDQYFPGGEYDAIARRKGSGAPASASAMPAPRAPATAPPNSSAARRGVTPTSAGRPRGGAGTATGGGPASAALRTENEQLKETVTGLERERDFYFSKLRDIELLLQEAVTANPEIEQDERGLIPSIQQILYSTEVSPIPPRAGEMGGMA